MSKVALCLTLLAAILGVSAANAQSCGGSLNCNTSSPSYLMSNVTGYGFVGEQGGVCSPANVSAPLGNNILDSPWHGGVW
jgi:hypothetical protein